MMGFASAKKVIIRVALALYVGVSMGIIIGEVIIDNEAKIAMLCQEEVIILKRSERSAKCPAGTFIEPLQDDDGNKYVICRCEQQTLPELTLPLPRLIPPTKERQLKGHVDDM